MNSECWLYAGIVTKNGYARLWAGGNWYSVHRLMYEQSVGEIPKGYDVDHLCRVRHCINPDHLEAVTHLQNCLRGIHATKDTCKYGHKLTPSNTMLRVSKRNGNIVRWRQCKTCHNNGSKESMRRLRAKSYT